MKFAQLCLTFCDPMDYTIHGILQARIPEWVAVLLSRGLFNPGIEPRSPALRVDVFFLPSEPPGDLPVVREASTKIEQDMMKPRGALGNHYQL